MWKSATKMCRTKLGGHKKHMKPHPKAKAPIMKWSLIEAMQVCSQPIDKHSGSNPFQDFLGNSDILVRTVAGQDLRSEQFPWCTGSKWDTCRPIVERPKKTLDLVEISLGKLKRYPYMRNVEINRLQGSAPMLWTWAMSRCSAHQTSYSADSSCSLFSRGLLASDRSRRQLEITSWQSWRSIMWSMSG